MNSSENARFHALIGVSQGVINKVELFDNFDTAQAALEQVRDDYHPEADELQLVTLPLTASSNSSHQISIVWTIHDIREVGTQKRISLTDDECIIVLESLEDNYDAGIGIDWNIVEIAIDSFLEQSKI